MIELLVGCLFPIMLTPDSLTEYRECQETKYMVYNVEEWLPTIQSYFKDEDVIRAAKVI